MFLLLLASHMVPTIAIPKHATVFMHLSLDQSSKTEKYYHENFCKCERESKETKIWTQ